MSDLLGGLGGLVKGLAGFMPQDDPKVKLLSIQSELSELEKQEKEIFMEIGRQAYEANPSAWPQEDKLKLIRSNMAAVQEKLSTAQQEKEAAEKAAQEADAATRCPGCGCQNPPGTKFCQECGAKLGGAAKAFCTSCGAELPAGTRFCGECGARQAEG